MILKIDIQILKWQMEERNRREITGTKAPIKSSTPWGRRKIMSKMKF